MTKFARLDNAAWCDPRDAVSAEALETQYHPDWVAARKTDGTWFQEVTDDIYNSLTTTPAPVFVPTLLSASGFQEICEIGFGGNAVGATRFGNVIRAMESSNDDLVFSLYQRFAKSVTFDKPKVTSFLTVLVNKPLITSAERAAILAAWPQTQVN